MKNCYFILILLFTAQLTTAQKIEKYHFVVEDKVFVDSLKGFYYGLDEEFSYDRIYIAKNIFKEKGLFGIAAGTTDTFKVSKGNWFIFFNGHWNLLFSKDLGIKTCNVRMVGSVFKLKMIKRLTFDNQKCFLLYLTSPVNSFASDLPEYIFNPNTGFVGISSNDDVTLKREAFKE